MSAPDGMYQYLAIISVYASNIRNSWGTNPREFDRFLSHRADALPDALRFAEGLIADCQVIEIAVRTNEGRRFTVLRTWKRTSAGNCHTARQTTLFPSQPCGGSTLPTGENAGLMGVAQAVVSILYTRRATKVIPSPRYSTTNTRIGIRALGFPCAMS